MEVRLQFQALAALFPEKEHPVDAYKLWGSMGSRYGMDILGR